MTAEKIWHRHTHTYRHVEGCRFCSLPDERDLDAWQYPEGYLTVVAYGQERYQ